MLLDYLDRLRKARMLVIGDVILDVFVYGKVSRISPEAPVPVVNVVSEKMTPGGAANVALNLKRLGIETTLFGIIGADQEGSFLENYLKESSINSYLLKDGRPTTVKTRVIAVSQQVVRIDKESSHNLTDKKLATVLKIIRDMLDNFDGIIISDYGKGMISKKLIRQLVELCNRNNKVITVDPKIENFSHYKEVTTLTPNHNEASSATGILIKDEPSLYRCGRYILKRLKSRSLVITRGAKGMTLFEDDKIETFPALAKEVYDVTGAGDTVISVLSAGLATDVPLRDAAVLSNIAAGIVVGKIGTATVSYEELKSGILDYLKQSKPYSQ
jgi:D-beta-D-heptose 7-phosphate kinase/D-beta-D-heptose 1-phosphate adenosyltransferase